MALYWRRNKPARGRSHSLVLRLTMKGRSMIGTAARTITVAAALVVAAGTATAQPSPVLYLTGTEFFTANGQNLIRYRYDVLNKDQYPAAMFAAAPGLPPCGNNA